MVEESTIAPGLHPVSPNDRENAVLSRRSSAPDLRTAVARLHEGLIASLDVDHSRGPRRQRLRKLVEEAAGSLVVSLDPRSTASCASGPSRSWPTRSSGSARSSRCSRTRPSPRSWSTRRTRSTSSATACIVHRATRSFRDETHMLRIIERIVAPIGRRVDEVVADGRRAPAGRLARQRHHPAAARRRPDRSRSASSAATATRSTTWWRSAR